MYVQHFVSFPKLNSCSVVEKSFPPPRFDFFFPVLSGRPVSVRPSETVVTIFLVHWYSFSQQLPRNSLIYINKLLHDPDVL